MSLTLEMVTVDCTDPRRLARWWATAVDGDVVDLPGGDFVLVTRPNWPALGFQRVGATETGRHSIGGGFRWVVLADPDGNAFCVAAPRPSLD